MGATAGRDLAVPGLRRTLKLRHLILYGIIIIQPTAPMSIYGVVSNAARGHVVTTILIAMVAMLFTAVSYGRMGGFIQARDRRTPMWARRSAGWPVIWWAGRC